MSKCEDVARILGLELGEEFEIGIVGEEDRKFKFLEHGFYSVRKCGGCWSSNPDTSHLLNRIISKPELIIKKPWKPKYSDEYWYHTYKGYNCLYWTESLEDLMRWKIGDCFKTKEEALKKGKEIIDKLKEEYENAS